MCPAYGLYFKTQLKQRKTNYTFLTKKNKFLNGEGQYYLVVRKLSGLLRARTSKRNDDFYCLNCLYSITTESKLKSHRKVCQNLCGVVMPSDDTKTLEFNQYLKSDKMPYIIYVDLESLIKRMNGCKAILKSHPQQNQINIFFAGIQCLRFKI